MKKYSTLLIIFTLLVQGFSINAMKGAQAKGAQARRARTFVEAVTQEEARLAGDHIAGTAPSNGWDGDQISASSASSSSADTSSSDEKEGDCVAPEAAEAEIAAATLPKTPELPDEESQIGRLLKLKTIRQTHLQCARTYLDDLTKPNTKTKDSMGSQFRKAIDETTRALKQIADTNGVNTIAALMQTV